MENKILFEKTFQRKLIYVFRINDETHKGYLKIGDATIKSELESGKLVPNCSELNKAAKKRINSYTNTAGIDYELLHTELALREECDKTGKRVLKSFRDKQVHKILQNSGINNVKLNNTTGSEWFKIDLKTAINAIKATKNNQVSLLPGEISNNNNPIIFRPEQKEAIKKTLTVFKTSDTMLWNAKMRFGKTLCALQVAKDLNYQKTLIITHRPVVNSGWQDDFYNIFKDSDFEYIAKGTKFDINKKIQQNQKFIYFKSIQDLRGSSLVGGNFDKNDEVFETKWDFVIIDEAHEGTTTSLGNDVKELLITKNHTKVLELSGTPFNILDKYEQNNVYTWDYMMEQSAKKRWDIKNFGDSNPYEELPEMRIFTYDLGESLGVSEYEEIEDKAFNFKEFFRTWTGEKSKDHKEMPVGAKVGDFVHEKDVKSFLNLIVKENATSNYPYSSEEYRSFFKHSLWMVPGVREAKALSALMKQHPIFGNGQFEIVNIAGDGDEEDASDEALTKVRTAIDNALKYDTYTITLSCGKLTTGVTIPEWTAVMMLSGSYSTSAANYLQTIFRVQSPANINGMRKEYCYVFDFAPDRTLKMVADAVQLSTKAGKANDADRKMMGEFLNFCPVVSFSGTQMIKYDESKLLQQLKRAYAERAVKSGFDDVNLYNDELLKLTDIEIQKFDNLKNIVGSSKAATKTKNIDINTQGLTNEEYEEIERIKKKPKKERSPEEEAKLKELNKQKEQRNKAISILRAISIRIPLLIYGADFNEDTEFISIQDLLKENIVDDASWEEFMPKDVTKDLFREFIKYYDLDVFNAASQKIRKIVKYADTLAPTERVIEISKLFSYFKNPDKETVLTPWRVVNMHMGDCLGGYNFFDEEYENEIEEPRYIYQGKVTYETLGNVNAKILEINSKTGLYPLYVTYSIFRSKCTDIKNTPIEEQRKLWNDTVLNNIFVICKTPMAKSITKRTLVGFSNTKVNAHYFEDLINTIKNKPKQFIERIKRQSYWNKKDGQEMKFDAVVGNPPYQDSEKVNNRQGAIYHYFYDIAAKLSDKYSLISPARFLFNTGLTPKEWNQKMLNDKHLKVVRYEEDATEIFPNTDIKGGVVISFHDAKADFGTIEKFIPDKQLQSLIKHFTYDNEHNLPSIMFGGRSDLKFTNEFISDYPNSIRDRIDAIREKHSSVNSLSPNEEYELKSSTFEVLPYVFSKTDIEGVDTYKILGLVSGKREYRYIPQKYMTARYPHRNNIDAYKVFVPESNGSGNFGEILSTPVVAEPYESCTPTFISIGNFKTSVEAKNTLKYIKTKLCRALLGIMKKTQHNSVPNWAYIPIQNFTENSDIDWSKSITEIDKQLYKKYDLSEDEINYIESMIKPME